MWQNTALWLVLHCAVRRNKNCCKRNCQTFSLSCGMGWGHTRLPSPKGTTHGCRILYSKLRQLLNLSLLSRSTRCSSLGWQTKTVSENYVIAASHHVIAASHHVIAALLLLCCCFVVGIVVIVNSRVYILLTLVNSRVYIHCTQQGAIQQRPYIRSW